MRRTTIVAALAAVIVTALPGTAHAASYFDQAVAGIKRAPVFVAEGTENTNSTTTSLLTSELLPHDYIVVVMLPSAAASETGNINDFAKKLDDATGHQHIVAVSVGDNVGTYTDLLPEGVAADRMNRATSVATNATETLDTFIRNVHTWQAAHPQEVKKPSPTAKASQPKSGKDSGWALKLLVCGLAVMLLSIGGLLYASRRRRNEASERGNPSVKLSTPKQIKDELQALLNLRPQLDNQSMRETITQLVRDVNAIFDRLPAGEEADAANEIEKHLQDLVGTLEMYIYIQNNQRYFPNVTTDMEDGVKALDGYAEYVLRSAQRAGRERLTRYKVSNKILSAQRYS